MPIQWMSTAQRARVSLHDLNALLGGRVHAVVAARLGLTAAALEALIAGEAHAVVPPWLGLENMAAAAELARALGREGVIGLLVARLLRP